MTKSHLFREMKLHMLPKSSNADWTAFEGVVWFLQKWSSPGPVQGLVVRSAVRSIVWSTVQKYTSLCALPKKFTSFNNLLIHKKFC